VKQYGTISTISEFCQVVGTSCVAVVDFGDEGEERIGMISLDFDVTC
jgi:hypothetical protein